MKLQNRPHMFPYGCGCFWLFIYWETWMWTGFCLNAAVCLWFLALSIEFHQKWSKEHFKVTSQNNFQMGLIVCQTKLNPSKSLFVLFLHSNIFFLLHKSNKKVLIERNKSWNLFVASPHPKKFLQRTFKSIIQKRLFNKWLCADDESGDERKSCEHFWKQAGGLKCCISQIK